MRHFILYFESQKEPPNRRPTVEGILALIKTSLLILALTPQNILNIRKGI